MSDISGRCLCGALTWSSSGPILWSALCHCEDCRRAASSDYVSWFGVLRSTVSWSGPRKFYRSSPKVMRSFCGQCGAPASFESEIFPDETHLYAATLDKPNLYRPTAHFFWSEHLPWVTVRDDLPKHQKGLQHAAQSGKDLLK
ncbi:GFA family protein [Oricola cellulosilytica]|uniref:GFA family protein n=1 Tax=Oricola cellulosilytica TaxID=1429082 RepID=A0A4R0P5J5_9HYPH|nr:GFA family protein [Oricola cellulosilytica]